MLQLLPLSLAELPMSLSVLRVLTERRDLSVVMVATDTNDYA